MTSKTIIYRLLLVHGLAFLTSCAIGQSPIRLYAGKSPGSETWKQKEAVYHDSSGSGEQFIYNVTDPTITIFSPDTPLSGRTAILVCPGGAFHVLGIDNEGYYVARWLNSIGITAAVLKYRLAESITHEPLKELGAKMKDFNRLDKENEPVIPLAIADADSAIKYLRQHAAELRINPDRIGIMGFSAGGTVAAGIGFGYQKNSRPDFVAAMYSYLEPLKNRTVPMDAPPLFAAACTDDPLGFAPHSTQLYDRWIAAKRPAEVHIFSKGGHGFGMKKQNLPVDQWRWLFRDWLKQQGYL